MSGRLKRNLRMESLSSIGRDPDEDFRVCDEDGKLIAYHADGSLPPIPLGEGRSVVLVSQTELGSDIALEMMGMRVKKRNRPYDPPEVQASKVVQAEYEAHPDEFS